MVNYKDSGIVCQDNIGHKMLGELEMFLFWFELYLLPDEVLHSLISNGYYLKSKLPLILRNIKRQLRYRLDPLFDLPEKFILAGKGHLDRTNRTYLVTPATALAIISDNGFACFHLNCCNEAFLNTDFTAVAFCLIDFDCNSRKFLIGAVQCRSSTFHVRSIQAIQIIAETDEHQRFEPDPEGGHIYPDMSDVRDESELRGTPHMHHRLCCRYHPSVRRVYPPDRGAEHHTS